MNLSYELRRSNRKTISVRIIPDGTIRVSAPYLIPRKMIDNFLQSKENRIKKHLSNLPLQSIKNKAIDKKEKEIALIQILPRLEYYAHIMNLTDKYGTVKITNATTKRWSCSSKWNLMFHRRLSELPMFVLDYVIVHELAHLTHFNHSIDFWNLVAQYYPNYKQTKKRLKENWHHWSIT